ncbi:cytochrome P450 71A1-like [Papaver somniferum]|uniref:cytochrome P450 71A1-like n=1 Tax=Papaver somniferum TaxID=3469 RepID=UPI000E704B33|nr:cytochrome P450 71A1-like [Papaver somniferum]
MFVGGSDTTATAVEWSMAELIQNPRLMKKAQEEESLRLHPPLPFLIGEFPLPLLKLEIDIPTNTGFFINAWAIQRDPKLWDKPEEFCPERFRNNPLILKFNWELPGGANSEELDMTEEGCKTLVLGVVGRSASARSLANRSLAFQMCVLYCNVPEVGSSVG